MKASHKERFVKFQSGKGCQSVKVIPGQFVFGRNKAAEVFGWSPSTTWNRLQRLAEINCISVASNNQYSIVTICNWSIYQSDEDKTVTTNGQAIDNQLTTNGQAIDTNKNVKNEENVKEKDIVEQPPRQRNGIPFNEIISYLNEKVGSQFRPTTDATKNHIRARWAENFNLDDFKTVIDFKTDEWKTDAKMLQYLRPATLFGTKFESYLQAARSKPGLEDSNLYGRFGKWKESVQ